MDIDAQAMYAKLAANEPLTEDETVAILKAMEHYKGCAAYLASCQADTLDGLPKSASKSARKRHVAICELAADMLAGGGAGKYRPDAESARKSCLRSAGENRLF